MARQVDDIGPETNAVSPFESTDYEEHCCQYVAVAPEDAPIFVDFGLQSVINSWPKLTDMRRAMIVRLALEIMDPSLPAKID